MDRAALPINSAPSIRSAPTLRAATPIALANGSRHKIGDTALGVGTDVRDRGLSCVLLHDGACGAAHSLISQFKIQPHANSYTSIISADRNQVRKSLLRGKRDLFPNNFNTSSAV